MLPKEFVTKSSSLSERGFTMIELLISMTIGLIILAAIYSVFSTQQAAYALQEQLTEMEQNVRIAVDAVTKDIKMAGSNPGGNTSLVMGSTLGITDSGANTITVVSTNNGTVTYTIDNTQQDAQGDPTIVLNRNGTTVAENLTNFALTYFDAASNQIVNPITVSDRKNIRKVRVSVTVRTAREDVSFASGFDKDGDPTTGTAHTETLTTEIVGRNLGL